MDTKLEEIRQQQRESWNKFSPGWKKWDELTMDFLKPIGVEMIKILNPKDDDIILDAASGTGEPGLTMAEMLTGGKVVIADIAEDMLEIAEWKAKNRGIENIETQECDICELPFNDNTFNSISCRLGFMFFPDLLLAAKEMKRVLKPGGKIAISVWSTPDKNFWVTATMGTIRKIMELPPPPKDAPGLFRCAEDGMLTGLLSKVGFKDIDQNEVNCILRCGTTDTYWKMMTEVGAPIVAALNEADEETEEKIKQEVYKLVEQKYPNGNVEMDATALVVFGEK